MSITNKRTRAFAFCTLVSVVAAAEAHAQVAPAPAAMSASPAPTFKAGWVAQVVSYKASAMGEVPLATFILGAAQENVFAPLSKLGIAGNEAGLVLRGLVNAPEAGRYGFLFTLTSSERDTACRYSLSIDGMELITGRNIFSQPMSGDRAVDLTAGRHPAELRLGCSNGLSKIRVGLKAKLPSADQVAPLDPDFILHPTRATGD